MSFRQIMDFENGSRQDANSGMKSINIETLMGHSIGISNSYYRATEEELLDEYLKAVDFLTIEEKYKLEKQVIQLSQRSKEENYMIKGQMLEKEEQIQTMMQKQEKFEQLIQSLIDSGQLKPDNNLH